MPSEFEYCNECTSHGVCFMRLQCVNNLCKPAATEGNIKALQQDIAALQALLNKERDEWHTAFMRNNDDWQVKYDALQQEFEGYKQTSIEFETALREQRDMYFAKYYEANEEREKIRIGYKKLREERDELKEDRNQHRAMVAQLAHKLSQAQQTIDQLTTERDELDKDNRALWKRVDAAERCVSQASFSHFTRAHGSIDDKSNLAQ